MSKNRGEVIKERERERERKQEIEREKEKQKNEKQGTFYLKFNRASGARTRRFGSRRNGFPIFHVIYIINGRCNAR